MTTDWNLIRTLMSTAIDACESVDKLGISEVDRSKSTKVNGTAVTVWDFLQSAWTYPESMKDKVIAARAQEGNAKPYMNEQARTLLQVAAVCAELVGAENSAGSPKANIKSEVVDMNSWYREHFMPGISKAMADA